ncbi:MAG: arsenate reductase (glutaredoxin) [Proteobacteria bacterium]|jgi:arsenate reductase (glutaredoxin)|nr:arsenate reductase (glutaredoxin) [Pseudomonadota bacterium]
MEFVIYHNPRCSKSRATLQLLQDNGISPQIIHYLDTPPNHQQLDSILRGLDIEPGELMRKGEPEYSELDLGNSAHGRDQLIEVMIANPRLIERPIVVAGDRIVIGRPPENVLELLN